MAFEPISDRAIDAPFEPISDRPLAEPPRTGRGFLGHLGDIGVSALKGVIGVPEALVGLADIPTLGAAGQAAEALGFRPKEAKTYLDTLLTPEQQAANQAVAEAQGFLPTLQKSLEYPSTIAHNVIESVPAMLGGGVIGRGLATGATKLSPFVAGAIGEGAVTAGQAAEQTRQETPGGRLSPQQAGAALASGAGTAAIGAASGGLAKKFNFFDVDTAIVQAQKTGRGLLRRAGESLVSEGAEELLQSAQEQAWQNVALGRPVMDRVLEAGATGMLAGAAMGGGASVVFGGARSQSQPQPQPAPQPEAEATAPPLALPYRPQPMGEVAAPGVTPEQMAAQQRADAIETARAEEAARQQTVAQHATDTALLEATGAPAAQVPSFAAFVRAQRAEAKTAGVTLTQDALQRRYLEAQQGWMAQDRATAQVLERAQALEVPVTPFKDFAKQLKKTANVTDPEIARSAWLGQLTRQADEVEARRAQGVPAAAPTLEGTLEVPLPKNLMPGGEVPQTAMAQAMAAARQKQVERVQAEREATLAAEEARQTLAAAGRPAVGARITPGPVVPGEAARNIAAGERTAAAAEAGEITGRTAVALPDALRAFEAVRASLPDVKGTGKLPQMIAAVLRGTKGQFANQITALRALAAERADTTRFKRGNEDEQLIGTLADRLVALGKPAAVPGIIPAAAAQLGVNTEETAHGAQALETQQVEPQAPAAQDLSLAAQATRAAAAAQAVVAPAPSPELTRQGTPRQRAAGAGRTEGTTDERHAPAPVKSASELDPWHMTLEQARRHGEESGRAWLRHLAVAAQNPQSQIAQELFARMEERDRAQVMALPEAERGAKAHELNQRRQLQLQAAHQQVAVDVQLARMREERAARQKAEAARALDQDIAAMERRKRALTVQELRDLAAEADERGNALAVGEVLAEAGRLAREVVAAPKPQTLDSLDARTELDVLSVLGTTGQPRAVNDVLRDLQRVAKSPVDKVLANALRLLGLKTRVVYTDLPWVFGEGARFSYAGGHYLDGAENLILIHRGGAKTSTVLHEIAHAATLARLGVAVANDARAERGEKLAPRETEEVQAARDLTDIFFQAKAAASPADAGRYGLTDLDEFIAEVWGRGDSRFIALLETTEAKTPAPAAGARQTLWAWLVKSIKRLLGLKMSDSLLERAMSASTAFFSNEVRGSGTARASVETFDTPKSALTATRNVLSGAARWADSAGPIRSKLHLAITTLNHLAQVYRNVVPLRPGETQTPMQIYAQAQDRGEAMATRLNQEANALTREMAKLEAQNKRLAERLYALMGESTRLGLWPDRPYAAPKGKDTPALKRKHAQLAAEYQALKDSGAAALFDRAAAFNATRFEQEYAVLLKNLGFLHQAPADLVAAIDPLAGRSRPAQALEEWFRTQAGEEAQRAFRGMEAWHQQVGTAPYFHLGRNGEYFVRFDLGDDPRAMDRVLDAFGSEGERGVVIDRDARHVFTRFETEGEMLAVHAQLAALAESGALKGLEGGKLEQNVTALDNTAPSFVRGMMGRIDADVHLAPEQKEAMKGLMRRVYIELLPEHAATKAFARRAGVPGYDADMRRSFAKRAQASSFFIANNTVQPEITRAMGEFRAGIKELQRDPARVKQAALAALVFDELKRRHANALTPIVTPGTDAFRALGHTYFLALNPAYILSNLLQPAQITLPVLGARYGYVKTAQAMTRAAGLAWRVLRDTVGDGWKDSGWTGVLDATIVIDRAKASAAQKAFLKALIASGQAEWTQAHEIGRVAEGENERVGTAVKLAGVMAHYSEAVNRITTGLAAFDLELQRHGDAARATEAGIQAVKDTQYDYSSHNVARALGKHGWLGPVTPVVASFMQFTAQTLELLGRLGRQAVQGDTSKAKREAQKALGGMLAATSLLAGTLGLPFVNVIAAAINGLVGSDDEPYDVIAAFRNWLADVFGVEAGELIARGLPRAAGIDLSTRVGMQDFFPLSRFLSDRRALKDRFDSGAMQTLGPSVGAAMGMVLGASKLLEGDILKGLEQALPSALKGPVKAYHLATKGYEDARGNALPLESSSWDVFAQGLGFTPAAKAEQSEATRSVKDVQGLLNQRAQQLSNRYYNAVEDGDAAAAQETLAQIRTFNAANPDRPIRALAQGLRRRALDRAVAKASGAAVEGSVRQLPRIREQVRFASTEGK